MQQYDVKLIKWGIIFFGEPATLKLSPTTIEVVKSDGSTVLSSSTTDLKKMVLNSNNGMWTLKAANGQKCNIAVKDDNTNEALLALKQSAGVKGMIV